jgi:uncharacterized protein
MISRTIAILTHLTILFVKDMDGHTNGKIMNVASTTAFQPGHLLTVGKASKVWAATDSENIVNELKESGVLVAMLCPEPKTTGFAKNLGLKHSRLFRWRKLATAADVAHYGHQAITSGKTVVIRRLVHKGFFEWFIPRKIIIASVRNI